VVKLKFGKFELDNLVSGEAPAVSSSNGGFYQVYHYTPRSERRSSRFKSSDRAFNPTFGNRVDQNQLGVEMSGHSEK